MWRYGTLKRIITTLIIATLIALMIPPTTAAETQTEEYLGTTGGRFLGYGTTVSWRPCPGGCGIDADEDGNDEATIPDMLKFGGGPLTASQPYNNVIVSVSDDIFGSSAATQACFWDPEGSTENVCGDDEGDHLSSATCGMIALLDAPHAGERVTVWVYSVVVTEDLDACGGWSGTMTGNFF